MKAKIILEQYIDSPIPLAKLAKLAGVTKQRIHQIIRADKGLSERRLTALKQSIEAKDLEKRRSAQKKYGGMLPLEFREDPLRREQAFKLHRKRAAAKNAGIEFDIEWGDLLWPDTCPVLGIALDYYSDGRTEQSVSFDRTDPTKGYVPGNVTIVSWRANRIKNDGTAEEHLAIARYLMELSSEVIV